MVRLAWLALLVPAPLAAQLVCPQPSDSTAALPNRPPDVLIRASVSARSLRFDAQPIVRVTTAGCLPWDTLVVTERVNLPKPVVPGVTYRDVRVGVEIRSWLDVVCRLPANAAGVDPCALLLDSANAPPRPR